MTTLRKAPRQQRSQETVAVILEAAAQLFQRHGYSATTTNKIAERAGVSVGSVYQYFRSKDAIVTAIADQQLEIASDLVTAVFARASREEMSLRELLTVLVREVASVHVDRPDLHRLQFDLAPRTPELVARFRDGERRLAAALSAVLRRLGVGGPDPDVTALLAVQGVEAQIHGVLLDPLPGRIADDVVDVIVEIWTRALAEPSQF